MVNIIRRKDWGATAGDGIGPRPPQYRPPGGSPDEAWLHHSVTKHLQANATRADEAAQMRAVERIGVQRFGAAYGFPYTFGLFPSGRAYEGHAYEQVGAHTGGSNSRGVGICWVGNYETHRPTKAIVRATAELLVQLRREGKLDSHRLDGGHRDSDRAVQLYGPTACPGRYAHPAIAAVNARADELFAGPRPSSTRVDARGVYTVREGDTLAELARTFRTSVDALVLLNGISDPDRIDVGDRLFTRWVVGRGDTLGAIAAQTGTTVDALVRLNGIRNPDRIDVGQLLRLP